MAKIIDNFIIVEQIGEGSNSTTQIGQNLMTKQNVAVKTIALDKFISNNILRDQVVNEIQVLKKMSHPQVIQMIKMLKSSNNIYLVFEFLQGASLEKTMHGSQLKLELAHNKQTPHHLMLKLCSTIAYIHRNNIIYNNLNPCNVYLWLNEESSQYELKLKNFLTSINLSSSEPSLNINGNNIINNEKEGNEIANGQTGSALHTRFFEPEMLQFASPETLRFVQECRLRKPKQSTSPNLRKANSNNNKATQSINLIGSSFPVSQLLEHVTQKSDIFSLGMMYYYLLVGTLPYESNSNDSINSIISSLQATVFNEAYLKEKLAAVHCEPIICELIYGMLSDTVADRTDLAKVIEILELYVQAKTDQEQSDQTGYEFKKSAQNVKLSDNKNLMNFIEVQQQSQNTNTNLQQFGKENALQKAAIAIALQKQSLTQKQEQTQRQSSSQSSNLNQVLPLTQATRTKITQRIFLERAKVAYILQTIYRTHTAPSIPYMCPASGAQENRIQQVKTLHLIAYSLLKKALFLQNRLLNALLPLPLNDSNHCALLQDILLRKDVTMAEYCEWVKSDPDSGNLRSMISIEAEELRNRALQLRANLQTMFHLQSHVSLQQGNLQFNSTNDIDTNNITVDRLLNTVIQDYINKETITLKKQFSPLNDKPNQNEDACDLASIDEQAFGELIFAFVKLVQKQCSHLDGNEQSHVLKMLNSLLEVLFIDEFFTHFVKPEITLHEQTYFRKIEGLTNDGLADLIMKKITYTFQKLNNTTAMKMQIGIINN